MIDYLIASFYQYSISFLVLYALWIHYIVAMGILRLKNDGKLTTPIKVMGTPAIVVAYGLDVISNIVICTLLFTDLPREWTVSGRLTRYYTEGKTGWRYKAAKWVLTQLLDGFDPTGEHRSTL